jgi:hypothetical protein
LDVNTREFFHGCGVGLVRLVKWAFFILSFPVPMALLTASIDHASPPLLTGVFFAQIRGAIEERRFFFAQANHRQNLNYQMIS